jgi:murein DD-endopeptidase MepM/ murein hydrolase activator NlpD
MRFAAVSFILLFLILPKVVFGMTYEPEVAVPGMTFSSIECQSGQECKITWLAEYVSGIFRYGVVAAAILATVMIMVAGFLWLTAAGSSSRIGTAKEIIASSFLGLFLALFSVIVLRMVNPELVNLNALTPTGLTSPEVSSNLDVSKEQDNIPGTTVYQNTVDSNRYDPNPYNAQLSALSPSEMAAATGRPELTKGYSPVSSIVVPTNGEFGNTRASGYLHGGTDMTVPQGSQVTSWKSGTVTKVVPPQAGNYSYIEITHDDQTISRYGHLSQTSVEIGQRVNQQQTIGSSGGQSGTAGAGNSTGPHLHFETTDQYGTAQDPCLSLGC